MSNKINICEIISGHFNTLIKSDDKILYGDVFTFILLPIGLGLLSCALGFSLDDKLSPLLVNFGSIFTALLLSVLVLVYDQESKLAKSDHSSDGYKRKKELLGQLYYNISYSILCSIALVILCFLNSIVMGNASVISINGFEFMEYEVTSFDIKIAYDVVFVTPMAIFFVTSLILNVIMIVKRMHSLLITTD